VCSSDLGEFNSDSSFGFKNRIINGAMVIDQRNAGASVTLDGSESFITDRFACGDVTDGTFTGQQVTDAPAGFINSLKCTVTSADTSLAATQTAYIKQPIEGLNITDLAWGTVNAKTVTLSFWVKSSLTGTFGGSLRNSGASRSYPFSYTISVADTWEYKTVTIAGDTSGTWLTTNGVGIDLGFSLGAGSDRTGTAGAWNANNNTGATGQTQVIGTNGATFYITGVQLEVGSTATSFDYRPYGTELALCQRYYFKTKPPAFSAISTGGYNSSTTVFQGFLQYPVTMRTFPTALEQSGTAGHYDVVNQNGATTCSSVPTYVDATDTIARTGFTVSSGLTGGGAGSARTNNANGFLAWSAEL
jgi:hypothetical protein